jgi:hypothetical protein
MNAVAKSEPRPGGWLFFEAAYCISLASRPDRRESAAEQFKTVGLQDQVEFVIVEKHPVNNEQGIYASHLICMAKGLAAGARHILIFEDDIVFKGFNFSKLAQCTDFLDKHPDCRLLFLGCLVTESRPTPSPGIRKVAYRALTHAYSIENSLATELVNKTWHRKPFDVVLADLPEDKFTFYPSFAFQSDSPSDNARLKKMELIRRFCGGLGFIQKMNERYHRHKAAIITGHVVVLAALLWLCLR